ncbi:hypothetical protein AC482_00475 [miscellaneous Crenarchaeota group-15 archaeon DG-45]|uniref:Uncharacterized protein n=1 Tax=miscellaneous Crenarchaeota group-15 archaeon DG-45 TaxID=1685127 RepID=A0A0M0BSV0_9ARCH|nr:MAG: hypothetical protein AC482_00475 [miscellaneous Crenarchaeota group-15 archaeon DG-45]
MFERFKIFLGIALLGFVAGVGIYFAYKLILRHFPFLSSEWLISEWLISGFVGMGFMLVIIPLWAYTTRGS